MKTRKLLIVLTVLILILAVCYFAVPQFRANVFVYCNHNKIEPGIRAGNGIPANDALFFDYKAVNIWNNEYHCMTEFLLCTRGSTYCGCYYSADDVPLAFQNIDVPLTQTGHDSWKWREYGDNRGITSKIMDHWYYFEATF